MSSGEPIHLDVLEGRPVRLPVPHHGDIKQMKWIHNSENVVFYSPAGDAIIHPNYTLQVNFSTKDYSLTLNNPQKSDKTEYKAEIDTLVGSEVVTYKYTRQLSVYEHAAAPILTVVSNQSSPDSCHVTLSCTAPGVAPRTFSCSQTKSTTVCSPEGQDSFLSISSSQSTVSCNHSNPVSWNQSTIELQPYCEGPAPSPPPPTSSPAWWIGLIAAGVIGTFFLLVGILWWKCKTKGCWTRQRSGHSNGAEGPERSGNGR